jgi:hypothetical protein
MLKITCGDRCDGEHTLNPTDIWVVGVGNIELMYCPNITLQNLRKMVEKSVAASNGRRGEASVITAIYQKIKGLL